MPSGSQEISAEYREALYSNRGPYIKERIVDVQYVAERVLRNLGGKEQESLSEINERVIIVAHELSPGDTSSINIGKIMGFITDVGGRTSHAAIMAQSLKIPAIVGLESVTQHVQDGCLLIVDGGTGEVMIHPDDELIIQYQERQLRQEKFDSSILRMGYLPAETTDGHRIEVRANIEFLEEVATAKDHGAEGLVHRTEFSISGSGATEEELLRTISRSPRSSLPTCDHPDAGHGGTGFIDLSLAQPNPALGLSDCFA
jgi:phosphotransferase system enzyme I (PtsI)